MHNGYEFSPSSAQLDLDLADAAHVQQIVDQPHQVPNVPLTLRGERLQLGQAGK